MDGSLKPADPQNKKDKETNIAHTKFIEDNATEKFGSGFLKRFTGKIGGIIVCGHEAGASLTISNLFLTLNHYGMLFPPYNNIYAMNTVLESTDKDKKNVNNKEFELEARLLAKNLITAAKIAKRKDDYWWVYDGRAD